MYFEVDAVTSLLLSTVFAFAFVGSLYIWHRATQVDRDDPLVIKQRLFSVSSVCIIAPIILLEFVREDTPEKYGPSFPSWLGLQWKGLLAATILPLLLTASIFLGPILCMVMDGSFKRILSFKRFASAPLSPFSPERRLITYRNYIGSPLCEEFIFRSCIGALLLNGGWSQTSILIWSPILFGLAHFHHLIGLVRFKGYTIKQSIITVCFQLFHTTLFGIYAAFLYLRTGHLMSCFISHMFANIMEFPDLGWLANPYHALYSRRKIIVVLYIGGILLFCRLLVPLTEPEYYESWTPTVLATNTTMPDKSGVDML